ncbi:phage major capsid protein [Anaerosolibacter sp.]|uniref:phage major capsid protein n=1 Tax=Anaerosolibacter sp. TaxID=1872527 RepID=UPI0039EF22BD
MYTNKEIAQFKRELSEIEVKRNALKEEIKNKRDGMAAEDIIQKTEELRTLNADIDALNEKLKDAPASEQRGGKFMNANANEITQENFRSSAQYRDAFFRSFINKGISQQDTEIMEMGKRAITDMNGGSVTSGAGYLVPTTTLNQIQTIINKYGQVYAAVTKYGFTGDVTLPIGTAGAPTDNGDGTTSLNFTFTEAKIQQSAVVATITVKNLLLKNSIPALEQYLAMEMGKYLGTYLDNAVINGDGAGGTFSGIIPAITAAPSEKETYSEMDWGVLMDIEADVDSPYGDDAVFLMRRKTFFNRFRKMTDASGAPITTTIPVITGNGKTQFVLDGHPVIFTNAMVEDDILFGDIKQYVVNESQEVVFDTSSEAGFAKDETMWRGKVYSGGTPMFAKTTFTYWGYSAT